MESINQPKVNNKAIAYRVGEFTSKFTIHPTLFTTLVNHYGCESKAREELRGLGVEAHNKKMPATAYVREKAMAIAFPKLVNSKRTSTKLVELRFSLNESSKKVSKSKQATSIVTMGDKMLQLCSLYEKDNKEGQESPLTELINTVYTENNGKDVSFILKDKILRHFAS